MSEGNGLDLPPERFRLDRQSGEVILIERNRRERALRPTMAAAHEIEERLQAGLSAVRTRFAHATWPFTVDVVSNPKMVVSTKDMAAVLAIGARAAGQPMTDKDAEAVVWENGVDWLALGLFHFVAACCDGGRLRADDAKNADSPNGLRRELNGEAKEIEATADAMTEAMTTESLSADTSD